MRFLKSKGIWFVVSLSVMQPLLAEAPEMQRLFLTPEQRAEIDQRRALYLEKPQSVSMKDSQIEALSSPAPQQQKPQPKSTPKPVSISAVVLLPNGDQLVRINQRFYKRTDQTNTATEAKVTVLGKEVFVPVGETYLPAKQQWVKSYKLAAPQKSEHSSSSLNAPKQKSLQPTEPSTGISSKMDLEALKQLQDTTP